MKKSYPMAMSVDQLMARSREIADVDLIDDEAVEPLTRLHRSLNEEGGLHEQGAVAQQNKLLRLLANRLRMKRDFQRHPEIAEQTIARPVVVYGMARSGTTKTQKLLATSGDFNWLPFWHQYHWASFTGQPNEDVTARIAETDAYCRYFDEMSPDTKKGHSFETFEPEEDTTLTEGCLRTVSFMGFAGVDSYLMWMMQQSALPMFEFLRDALKYLQWQGLATPGKPWLLKAPIYYGLERELLQVFPDARLVMLHRDPKQTVPSSCKLLEEFHKPFSTARQDPQALLQGFIMQIDRHLSLREEGGLPVLDVTFDQLNNAPDGVLARIYAHAGVPLAPASRARMQGWLDHNPMHKHGKFEYALSDYGLDGATIEQAFARYLAFFKTL